MDRFIKYTYFRFSDLLYTEIEDNNILKIIASLTDSQPLFMVDKNGYFNSKSSFKLDKDFNNRNIFDIENTKYLNSFSDVCEYTMNNLYNTMTDKKINVLWSGGTDSTCVLSLCIKYFNKNRINIMCTKNSIKEAPEVFQWLANNNFNIELLNGGLFDLNNIWTYDRIKNEILLSGCYADFLYKYDVLKDIYHCDLFNTNLINSNNWKTFLLQNFNIPVKDRLNFVKEIEKYLSYCNININSFENLLWFLELSFVWSEGIYLIEHCVESVLDNHYIFFNNNYFDKYSIIKYLYNNEKDDKKLYKMESKNIIYNILHIEEIFNMKKNFSIKDEMDKSRYRNKYMIFDNNGVNIINGNRDRCIQELNLNYRR